MRRAIIGSIVLLSAVIGFEQGGSAAVIPSGFTDTQVVSGLTNPTAMALAPDGRIFIAQQGGQLRVVKDGALLAQPFLTVIVNASGERGLLGVAFDPGFAGNHFVYVYYTATAPAIHNRLSRFTANGDVAIAGSETILLELDNLSSATNHNGGAIHFGPDGKLYIAVGDNANGANAQTLTNLLGKILRINANGTIPADNPFVNQTTGRNAAIWALGLRNPFTFAFQSGVGRMFINDVGQNTFEEINDGIIASNYGWPATEGPTTNPSYVSPLYSYGHGGGAFGGCAITGGAFYNPTCRSSRRSTQASISLPTIAPAGSTCSIRAREQPRRLHRVSRRRLTCRSPQMAASTILRAARVPSAESLTPRASRRRSRSTL